MSQFKIIHDSDYAEDHIGHNSYLIAKVYNQDDGEVGAIKLEVFDHPTEGPVIRTTTTGGVKVDASGAFHIQPRPGA
jgi:hypothetical protein